MELNKLLLITTLFAIGAFALHVKAEEGGVFRPKLESAPPDAAMGLTEYRPSYQPSKEQIKENEKPPITVEKIDVEKDFPIPAKKVSSLITSQVGSRYERERVDFDMDLVSKKFPLPRKLHVQCWYSQDGKSVTLIFGLHTPPPSL